MWGPWCVSLGSCSRLRLLTARATTKGEVEKLPDVSAAYEFLALGRDSWQKIFTWVQLVQL